MTTTLTQTPILSEEQKSKLSDYFRTNRLVMTHQMAVALGFSLEQSIAILEALEERELAQKIEVFYHSCTEEPIGCEAPAFCPNCEEEIEEIVSDSLFKTFVPILFI